MKRRISIILTAVILVLLLVGCAAGQPEAVEYVRNFIDSSGRTVAIPENVEHIVPSGPLAQMILYTLCPDKLQSLAVPLTRKQKTYIDERYWDLPVTGQFYSGGGTISYEAIVASDPDLILDVGEAKDEIAADMDLLQEITGIPSVFIHAELDDFAEAYEKLGELTGDTKQATACADYIRETLKEAESGVVQIPEGQRKRVLYAEGEYGTEVMGTGSIHSQILDMVGAVNVAELEAVAANGTGEVSMEQILLWDPEVVILAPDSNFDEIFDDPVWANVQAVQIGAVYEVPDAPYNWMDRPPAVQRVLAVKWLGNLLYPEIFDLDMVAETQIFYQLFFHYDLSREMAEALLANSTGRIGGEP